MFEQENASARLVRAALISAVAALLLAFAAQAIAAAPKKGAHFNGKTTATPVNGFPAPVKFTVSSDGKKLTGFVYSSFGCFGAGGFRPGVDYYTMPAAEMKVGTIKVGKGGTFSISGAASTYESHGTKTVTTSKVSGRFTKAKLATGTISLSQKTSGQFQSTCGPGVVTFTAQAE